MRRPSHGQSVLFAAGVAAALAGCSRVGDSAAELAPGGDPAVTLGAPMTGDLEGGGGGLAGSAWGDNSLAAIDRGADAVAFARTDALRLVGGPGMMMQAPEPGESATRLSAEAALAAAERAAVSPGGGGDCLAGARYAMHWAARLPATFPVYPRAAVQDAAGTDDAGCSLRKVSFITPVPRDEVIDFYFSRARAAGFSARRALRSGDDVLGGVRNSSVYLVYARRLPSGNTEVELVTSGT